MKKKEFIIPAEWYQHIAGTEHQIRGLELAWWDRVENENTESLRAYLQQYHNLTEVIGSDKMLGSDDLVVALLELPPEIVTAISESATKFKATFLKKFGQLCFDSARLGEDGVKEKETYAAMSNMLCIVAKELRGGIEDLSLIAGNIRLISEYAEMLSMIIFPNLYTNTNYLPAAGRDWAREYAWEVVQLVLSTEQGHRNSMPGADRTRVAMENLADLARILPSPTSNIANMTYVWSEESIKQIAGLAKSLSKEDAYAIKCALNGTEFNYQALEVALILSKPRNSAAIGIAPIEISADLMVGCA